MDKPHTIIYEQNSTWRKQHKFSGMLTVPCNKTNFKLSQLDAETWHHGFRLKKTIDMTCWFFFVDSSVGISATVIDHANKLEYSSVMKTIASDTSGVNYIYIDQAIPSQIHPSKTPLSAFHWWYFALQDVMRRCVNLRLQIKYLERMRWGEEIS